jgi:hypothetical protein
MIPDAVQEISFMFVTISKDAAIHAQDKWEDGIVTSRTVANANVPSL